MIKFVYFDFGGVLTEGGRRGFIKRSLSELYGLPEDAMRIEDMHLQLRRGQIDADTFFAELNRRYGRDHRITEREFVSRLRDGLTRSEPVYHLAAQLRAHGIGTGILSNVFEMNARELEEDGCYDGFSPVILSCREGYAKPDLEIYHTAIRRAGVTAQEILFIDDQVKATQPAIRLGMQVILAETPEQIVADTQALILKENSVSLVQ